MTHVFFTQGHDLFDMHVVFGRYLAFLPPIRSYMAAVQPVLRADLMIISFEVVRRIVSHALAMSDVLFVQREPGRYRRRPFGRSCIKNRSEGQLRADPPTTRPTATAHLHFLHGEGASQSAKCCTYLHIRFRGFASGAAIARFEDIRGQGTNQ